jgi:hypothetical protein
MQRSTATSFTSSEKRLMSVALTDLWVAAKRQGLGRLPKQESRFSSATRKETWSGLFGGHSALR